MSGFVTRTITAAVFVIVLVGSFMLHQYTALALTGILILVGTFEYVNLSSKVGNRKDYFDALLLAGLFFGITAAWILRKTELTSLLYFLIAIPVILIAKLFRKSDSALNDLGTSLVPLLYIALPFTCLLLLGHQQYSTYTEYHFEPILAYFFVIWANDTGAYLVGRSFGKHKMFERISPKKTWEGTLGGVIAGTGVAVANFYIFDLYTITDWIILGLLITSSGTLGDLVESMLKRNARVKDSGKIMPGHGGVLDRFDSTLLAAPLSYAYLSLFVF